MFRASVVRVRAHGAKEQLRRAVGLWAALAAQGRANDSAVHHARQAGLARQQAAQAAQQALEAGSAAGARAAAAERDKYKARSAALQEEVTELNQELEELYERHGHIKRQLLVLRHSTSNLPAAS